MINSQVTLTAQLGAGAGVASRYPVCMCAVGMHAMRSSVRAGVATQPVHCTLVCELSELLTFCGSVRAAKARTPIKEVRRRRLVLLDDVISIVIAHDDLCNQARGHRDARRPNDRTQQEHDIAGPTSLLQDVVDQTLPNLARDEPE